MRPLLAAGLAWLPALASACSACARDSGRYGQVLVAALALFPFAVAGVVAGLVRRASSSGRGAHPEADA